MTADREVLGRIVRQAWTDWAAGQPDVADHPSWLVGWDGLPERDREVDRLIGEAVAAHVTAGTAGLVRELTRRAELAEMRTKKIGADLERERGYAREQAVNAERWRQLRVFARRWSRDRLIPACDRADVADLIDPPSRAEVAARRAAPAGGQVSDAAGPTRAGSVHIGPPDAESLTTPASSGRTPPPDPEAP